MKRQSAVRAQVAPAPALCCGVCFRLALDLLQLYLCDPDSAHFESDFNDAFKPGLVLATGGSCPLAPMSANDLFLKQNKI